MKKLILSTALAALFAGTSAFGANFTTTTHAAGGIDWTTVGAGWSSGAGATAGNTYEALTSAGTTVVRDPSASVATFPGTSLQLDGNGDMLLNNGSITATGGDVAVLQMKNGYSGNVILNGGVLNMGNSGAFDIGGTLNVLATSTLNNEFTYNSGLSTQTMSAALSGSGLLQVTGTGTGSAGTGAASYANPTLTINSSSNTFSGGWYVNDGFLFGSGTGSLGTGNISLLNHSVLETGYTFLDASNSLTLGTNAVLDLNQNWTFLQMTYGSTTLNTGTYNMAQLETAFGMTASNFNAGSTATNTITLGPTPEPSSLALLGLGAVGLLLVARRSRGLVS